MQGGSQSARTTEIMCVFVLTLYSSECCFNNNICNLWWDFLRFLTKRYYKVFLSRLMCLQHISEKQVRKLAFPTFI